MPYKVIINYAAQPSTPEIDSQFCSSRTRLCERRQLWRHLILPQHLLPWHSVCWNTVIPSSDMLQTQEKWGKRVYLIFLKCSTSKLITCILWLKPARHKAAHRLVANSFGSFTMSFLLGLQSFWRLSDNYEQAVLHRHEALSAVGAPAFTSHSPQKE